MAGKSPRYVANRPFGYDTGLDLDRGQVFELRNLRNDEKLTRLGYVRELAASESPVQCGHCGSEFVGDAERAAHGLERHRERELTPYEEDQHYDRQEKLLAEVAPIKMDKTAAANK